MSEILSYLNSPHLVANFQKVFGVEPQFNSSGESQDEEHSPLSRVKDSKSRSYNQRLNTTMSTSKKGEQISNSNSSATSTITLTKTSIEATTARIRKPTIDENSKDGMTPNCHTRTNSSSGIKKQLVYVTDHSNLIANTTIHSRFWYYFFHAGAAMGNEAFFSIFFPFWFWNVDGAIARKVALLWGIFMYVGQATKDLVCSPRPASPPVVKLEERYIAEYGFPSTHAMISAGLPFSLVYLSYSRYNIDLTVSIVIAAAFCCWVCCSRLYLGMHSLLDVIAGVLYALFVLFIVIPFLEPLDAFLITCDQAPLISLCIGFGLCYFYPSLKQWSTARGDTTIIIGTVVGFSVGAYFNNRLGFLERPASPPLYDIHFPNALGYVHAIVRTILGIIMFLVCRFVLKRSLYRLICSVQGLDPSQPNTKRQKCVELPYNYFSYFVLGTNIAFMSPYVFRALNIERDYSYTEL